MLTRRIAAIIGMAILMASCAAKAVPPLPAAPKYPDFMYPAVPPELSGVDQAARIDAGWRFLQNDDLRRADREFAAALKGSPGLYPARVGSGYVALAQQDFDAALGSFDAVLRPASRYVPALVGRGQALLALNRDAEALAAFETALAVDASLTDVRRRVDVLRFRGLEDLIEKAREAAAGGRLDEAQRAYDAALMASPESAFLHRELGAVARRQGNADAALQHFRQAAELDPADTVSLVQIGELHEARQEFSDAEAAYRRATAIESTPDLARRLAAIADRAREARLPAEFRAIPTEPRITRGDLAALVGIRLDDVLRALAPRDVVMTDVSGHWAASWITQVSRAGVMEVFANHTFQPSTIVTRADLAGAVSRLVALMALSRPELRQRLAERPRIADMSIGHLSYPAASVEVASGVMPLRDGDRFENERPVSGAEAVEAVRRLRSRFLHGRIIGQRRRGGVLQPSKRRSDQVASAAEQDEAIREDDEAGGRLEGGVAIHRLRRMDFSSGRGAGKRRLDQTVNQVGPPRVDDEQSARLPAVRVDFGDRQRRAFNGLERLQESRTDQHRRTRSARF